MTSAFPDRRFWHTKSCLNPFIYSYHIPTKTSTISSATRTTTFVESVQGVQYDNIALQCKYEKKIQRAHSQSSQENQLKQLVLVWITATLLIKWKLNLRNLPVDSETGTPCIDIKTFELNFQLNFERFDVNFIFFMKMSHSKLEITKRKHQEQVWNVLEMHLMMTSRSLWITDSFLSFLQSVNP